MSIFFKRVTLIAVYWLLGYSVMLATNLEYNPAYVDSILTSSRDSVVVADFIEDYIGSPTSISDSSWDVQPLKSPRGASSMVIYIPFLLMVLIIYKLLYSEFLHGIMPGMWSTHAFSLHYKNKRYSSLVAIVLQYIVKLVSISFAIQYGLFLSTSKQDFLAPKYAFILLGFTASVLTLLYFLEYLTQLAIGFGDWFKVYFVQYNIVTTWVWIPLIIILLVAHLNEFQMDTRQYLMLLAVPMFILPIVATIRSWLIMNGRQGGVLIYFFMYLCTFKIIPYWVILKFAIGY